MKYNKIIYIMEYTARAWKDHIMANNGHVGFGFKKDKVDIVFKLLLI